MISVAVIGAGVNSLRHLQAIDSNPKTKLCAVADIISEKAYAAAAPYGAVHYTDYLKMLNAEQPDAVIVNLPHYLHESCAISCAQHGAHVLLEKPMSISAESCHRICKAFQQAGRLLQIGHVQRYMRENRAAKALIDSGTLGEIVFVEDTRVTNYFTAARPRWFFQKAQAGGGISLNFGAHSLDKLCYLTDSKIDSLVGHCTYACADADVDGSAQMYVKMRNGVSATISLCGYTVTPRNETMIYLTRGALRLRTGQDLWISLNGKDERLSTDEYPDPFAAQWDDFIESISLGKQIACTGDYGMHIVEKISSVWTK